jgi:hypothetical protein
MKAERKVVHLVWMMEYLTAARMVEMRVCWKKDELLAELWEYRLVDQ